MNIWLILAGVAVAGTGAAMYLFVYGRFLATLHRLLLGHLGGTVLRKARLYRPWMARPGRWLGYDISGEGADTGTEELKRHKPSRAGGVIGLIGLVMQFVGVLLSVAGITGFGILGNAP